MIELSHRPTQTGTDGLRSVGFFNRPLIAAPDEVHSSTEPRFYALGQTDASRSLFIAFTIRGRLIRVVSARDMNRRERKVFEGL